MMVELYHRLHSFWLDAVIEYIWWGKEKCLESDLLPCREIMVAEVCACSIDPVRIRGSKQS